MVINHGSPARLQQLIVQTASKNSCARRVYGVARIANRFFSTEGIATFLFCHPNLWRIQGKAEQQRFPHCHFERSEAKSRNLASNEI